MRETSKLLSCLSSFSSVILFLVVVPLVLVPGVVFVLGPDISSSSNISSSLWPWSRTIPSSTTKGSSHRHVDFQTKMVELEPHHKEEPLADALTFNDTFTLPAKETPKRHHPSYLEKKKPEETVNSSNESNSFLVRRRAHHRISRLKKLESSLANARVAIRESARNGNQTTDQYYVPRGGVYSNPSAFQRSYLEMEKQFKVFIYEEGEPPLFHNGPCKSIYSTEGNFIHELEIDPRFRTRDPDKAHVFFLPFSVTMMVQFIYVSNSHDTEPIKQTVSDYVNVIGMKYPYWNRSLGADHFMLSCHDWGPLASSFVPLLHSNSIRVLCNANTSEGFNPSKDASFPEINLKTGQTKGWIGGPSPSHRPLLAFFAGGLHGPIRPLLLNHWKNVDEEIQVHEYLPKGMHYYDMMKKAKYCICPSGYEVASPRIVEAIYTGCVPVLISDHYVPPFSDVLNWKSFSVVISPNEIPNMKRILMGISQTQYIRMQRRVLKVRRHFEVNSPPKRFDVFHMILHSIWLRRLNVRIYDDFIPKRH